VLERYPDQVKLLFLSYPLRSHPYSKKAAVAAFAAKKQGKFWEYHDLLFKYQDTLDDQKFLQIAHELGLDMERFEEDIKDLKTVVRVNQDIRLGSYVRVRGTPTVFINGKVSKARTLPALQADVEQELKKVKKEKELKSQGKG
jgi:protein-disulfide isomerase